MPEDEKKAEKGAILLEWQEVEDELRQRRSQAEELGQKLIAIGSLLSNAPERIIFEREETPLQFDSRETYSDAGLSRARIVEIRDSIRAMLVRRNDLERRKSAFGLQ
jgi:hypothetical protein